MKSAGPELRMNTARKEEFARAQEDQSTQKLTVLLNRQGWQNWETQTGMLSHFQKIGVASHFVGMLGTQKKKKTLRLLRLWQKNTHTHTLAMSNKIRGTYDFCCQLHEIQCHMKSLKLGRDIFRRSKTQNNAKSLGKSVQAKLQRGVDHGRERTSLRAQDDQAKRANGREKKNIEFSK